MNDIETLLGEEAVDPHFEKNDRETKESPAKAGEDAAARGAATRGAAAREDDENLPIPVRSPERRAEAFLTEWLRRLARS